MTLSLIDADADFGGICTSLSGYCSQNDFKTIFVGRVHAGVGIPVTRVSYSGRGGWVDLILLGNWSLPTVQEGPPGGKAGGGR